MREALIWAPLLGVDRFAFEDIVNEKQLPGRKGEWKGRRRWRCGGEKERKKRLEEVDGWIY